MQRRTKIYLAVGIGVFTVLCILGVVLAVFIASFIRMYPTEGMDRKFGDQHLKTAVALIELHKVRYGEYPETLDDLKYTGDRDIIALLSVEYTPNADHTAYYVEVERGWAGRPQLETPPGFWRGTGYREKLDPDG
jgi:hypothetical protein